MGVVQAFLIWYYISEEVVTMRNNDKYFHMTISSVSKGISILATDFAKKFAKMPSKDRKIDTNERFLWYIPRAYKNSARDSLTKQGIRSDYKKTGEDLFKALNKYEQERGFTQTKHIKFSK